MSKKDRWYKQCRYRTEGGKIGISWIPEILAKLGKKIYFGKKGQTVGERELWEVIAVYSKQKESFLIEHQMDYKHQRKVSDI